MTRSSASVQSAYFERACQILAMREHSVWELRRKLLQKGCPAEVTEAILEQLQSAGWLSDARFAEALVRQKVAQGWGKQRVVLELRRRGVSDLDSEGALSVCAAEFSEECEIERAERIVRKRLRCATDVAKVKRYLIGRGFSMSCAVRAVENGLLDLTSEGKSC